MAGTPMRCARVFSSGIRARLTISYASSASVFSLLHVLGRFCVSHGVDRDKTSGNQHTIGQKCHIMSANALSERVTMEDFDFDRVNNFARTG